MKAGEEEQASSSTSTSSSSSSLYNVLFKNATQELANRFMFGDGDGGGTATNDDENDGKSDDVDSIVKSFTSTDYRGFIFVIHPSHGIMLLYCTRKKNKPNHYQCPGGHVDEYEFQNAAAESATQDNDDIQIKRNRILYVACRAGAARELYEETGIDVRSKHDLETRLLPVVLLHPHDKKKKKKLPNEYKDRFFFLLKVNDDDFYNASKDKDSGCGHGGGGTTSRVEHAQGEIGNHLKVRRHSSQTNMPSIMFAVLVITFWLYLSLSRSDM